MRAVRSIGVADREGGVAHAIAEGLRRWRPEAPETGEEPLLLMQVAAEAEQLCAMRPALLVLAGESAEAAGEAPFCCPYLLLPGEAAGEAARRFSPGCAVSYGMSQRDSLTLSSTTGKRIVLALQRELTTLDGRVLERQEIPLRPWLPARPRTLLAAAGALLLLGVSPETLMRPDPSP